MRKLIFTVLACGAIVSPALADPLTVEITNKTPEVIKTITAVPRAGGQLIEVSKTEIAVGGASAVEFEAPVSTCVFTLTSLLASGKTVVNEDVFLCHTKSLDIK